MAFFQQFRNKKNVLLALATALATSIAASAYASSPTQAFQKAEYLGQIIERLLHSDLYDGKLTVDPDVSPSRPRHVLRLAAYAYENVQFLRSMNGLPENAEIHTHAKEVKPDDVINLLEAAIQSAQALGPVYRVDLNFPEPPIQSEKTPGDVLARLRAVNAGLIKLGAPKPLPNDVFRISLAINAQVKAMTSAEGITVRGEVEKIQNASPSDALNEATNLIRDLEKLTNSNKKFSLPNGVAAPPTPEKGKPITPANVLLATQFALADVYSLNVASGYKEDLILPPVQSGHNPADVKNTLAEARLHINALSQSK